MCGVEEKSSIEIDEKSEEMTHNGDNEGSQTKTVSMLSMQRKKKTKGCS